MSDVQIAFELLFDFGILLVVFIGLPWALGLTGKKKGTRL